PTRRNRHRQGSVRCRPNSLQRSRKGGTAMVKFALVPVSLASNRGLGSDAQVYIVLMSYADEKTGHAWPKVETLARLTGLHERTVQRSLRRLVDARLIKMELPKPGHPRSNVYSIVDHPGVTVSPPL